MPDGFDHNQLATLHEMEVSYDRESGVFVYSRTFDFSRSPHLEAEPVAESWEEAVDSGEVRAPDASISVDGDRMTLTFRQEDVETRHGLKSMIGMELSEALCMVCTHDSSQGVELAEQLVEIAEEMDRFGGPD